jgi:hypothetical protein
MQHDSRKLRALLANPFENEPIRELHGLIIMAKFVRRLGQQLKGVARHASAVSVGD